MQQYIKKTQALIETNIVIFKDSFLKSLYFMIFITVFIV